MGHINNMVVQMVRDNLGEDGVAELFGAAGIETRKYSPEIIYPNEEFQALFRGAQQVFGVESDAAEKAFSSYFMEVSPRMFPAIFEQAGSARGLIEKIPVIHRNFPAAASQSEFRDKIFILDSTPHSMVLEYDSPNQLCITLRTVAGLTLEYYGESGSVVETACQKKGDPRCQLVMEFNGRS